MHSHFKTVVDRNGACGLALRRRGAGAGRDDQGRHPALALGDDGDLRDDAEGRHADADRGAERQGRAARQAARGGGGRSGLGLAALRREGARSDRGNQGVDVVFGCWTSVSRKSVLPVFEELNSILFYPVQYEGQESQRNVFYTGAAPNQQAIPAVDYLMNEEGVERWVLAGTDYVYPRTTNQILEAYLKAERRRRRGHHDQLHAVRAFRLADDRERHQGVRLDGQEDGGGLDDQRRRQRAVLQGARQPGHLRRRTSRSSPSRSARRSWRASTPRRWSGTSRPGTTS